MINSVLIRFSVLVAFSVIFFHFSNAQLKLQPLGADLSRNTHISKESLLKNNRSELLVDTVKPFVAIDIIEGYNPRCSSENNLNLKFAVNFCNGGANPSFEWYVNGINQGNGNTFESNSLQNNDSVQCLMTSSLSCIKKQSVYSNKIKIVYRDSLKPEIILVAKDNVQLSCSANYPITISATTLNGGSNPEISWYYNNTLTSTIGNIYKRDTMPDKSFVYAQLKSSLSCASKTISGVSNYITRTVPRIISPSVALVLDSVTNPNCGQKIFNYRAITSNQGLKPLFRWYLNNKLVQTTTSFNFNTTLENNGDEVYVSLASSLSCANPSVVSSNNLFRADTISLPFFEDFSTSFDQPDINKWLKKGGTYINNTYPIGQPSHNVASFDGLRYDGYAYDTLSPIARGVADQLISLPFDLSNTPDNQKDSIYISFFWEPNGLGEAPDVVQGDSLALYFKNSNQEWIHVWGKKGFADTVFRRAIVKVNSDSLNNFLHGSFQFKFENTGRLSGNFDLWNLDYIYLNSGRWQFDTNFVDQCFSKQPLLFLKDNYLSVPISHFQTFKNSLGDNDTISTTYNNINNLNIANNTYLIFGFNGFKTYKLTVFDTSRTTLESTFGEILSVSIPGFFWSEVPSLKTELEFKFTLNGDLNNSDGKQIDYTVNNELKSKTILDNYYAYDDGTAEYGIGINQRFACLLYKFKNYKQGDTLKQVVMHLPQLGTFLINQSFNLLITTNLANRIDFTTTPSPSNVLYNENHPISYAKTVNNWTVYDLNKPVILNVDSFYVGYRQITDDPFIIGWDKNTNTSSNIYYNINNRWENYDETSGSLMIRPVFGTFNYLLSTNERTLNSEEVVLFPIPAEEYIRSNTLVDNAYIFDLQGVMHRSYSKTQYFDVSNLPSGLYVIKLEIDGKTLWKKVFRQ